MGWKYYIHHGHSNRPRGGWYQGPFDHDEYVRPAGCHRAHVCLQPNGRARCKGHAPNPIHLPVTDPNNFADHLASLTPTQKFLLADLEFSNDDLHAIADSIEAGTALAVSDGSFFETSSIAAFQLRMETGQKTNQICASQYVPGRLQDNDAYRAEATGLLAIFSLLEAICLYRNIREGQVVVACDGESALDLAFHDTWDVRTTDKQHDIFQCIHETRKRLPPGLTVTKRWVRGHSDDIIPYHRMTRTQQLNVDCDRGAKTKASITPPLDRPSSVSGDAWEIQLRGDRLVHRLDEDIRKWIHDPALLDRWATDERLAEGSHHLIDWTAQSHATKKVSRRRSIGIAKLFSDNCATNERMVEWGFRGCSKCARCNHPVENVTHLLQCPDRAATCDWDSAVDKLDAALRQSRTHPQLQTIITRRLKAWKRNEPWRLHGTSAEIRLLQDDQQSIGWKNFLFGFLSTRWATIQQSYYSIYNPRRSGAKWACDLIPMMWEILWSQWRHRNSIVHKNHETTGARPMEEIDQEIQTEFSLGLPHRCPPHLRCYFRGPITRILSRNGLDRRLWLKTAQGVRHLVTSLLVNHDGLSNERRVMRQWLAPPP